MTSLDQGQGHFTVKFTKKYLAHTKHVSGSAVMSSFHLPWNSFHDFYIVVEVFALFFIKFSKIFGKIIRIKLFPIILFFSVFEMMTVDPMGFSRSWIWLQQNTIEYVILDSRLENFILYGCIINENAIYLASNIEKIIGK